MASARRKNLLSRIKQFLKNLFIEDFKLKLISFFITILIWISVFGSEDVTKTVDVPIFLTIPEDRVLVSDVPNSVRITVSGPWANIKSWDPGNLRLDLSLKQGELGTNVIYIEESLFDLTPTLNLMRINPSEISVNLAKKNSKLVSIVPMTTGQPAKGYKIKSVTPEPSEMLVEGAIGDLAIVEEVLTEDIDVTDRNQTFTTTAKPVRLSKNIQFPSKKEIVVTVEIVRDLIENTFQKVGIQVVNSKFITSVKPETIAITIAGPRHLVQRVTPKDLQVYIDATKEEGDNPGTTTNRELEFSRLPKQVKMKPSTRTAKLTITHALVTDKPLNFPLPPNDDEKKTESPSPKQ